MTTHYISGASSITKQQVEKNLLEMLPSMSPLDICFTWCVRERRLGVYDVNEIGGQIEHWIRESKEANNKKMFQMKDYNNKTKTIKGKVFYACVLQKFTGRTELDEDGVEHDEMEADANPTDVFALMCGEEWVSGYTYYFTNAYLRDWCVQCVNTGVFQKMTRTIVDTPECCLCKSPCENQWGNNAQPVADGVCCDSCSRIHVLSARLARKVRDIHQAPPPKEETEEERNQRLQLVAELEKTATPIVVCDATIEVEKVKKVQEKSRTKDANKAQNDKKRQRAEYEKQIVKAENARKQAEAQKKQYQQQQKAKAKK